MAHYDDVILPTYIEVGAETAPRRAVDVVYFDSGYRAANARWSQSLRTLTVSYINEPEQIAPIIEIFEAVGGPLHSFLVRDWGDWNTTNGSMNTSAALSDVTNLDQPMQNTTDETFLGDGSTTVFQLGKRSLVGTASHFRKTTKPQSGTVTIAVNGVAKTEGPDYTVDYATGLVDFASAPAASAVVTWGGAFYVPVAFANESLPTTIEGFTQQTPSIELIEVRL